MSGGRVVRVPSLSNPADSYYQDAEPPPRIPAGRQSDGEAAPQVDGEAAPHPRIPASPPAEGKGDSAASARTTTPKAKSSTAAPKKNRTGTYGQPHVGRSGGAGTIKIGVSVSRECALRLRAFAATLDPGVDARNKWVERVIMQALDREKSKRGRSNEFAND